LDEANSTLIIIIIIIIIIILITVTTTTIIIVVTTTTTTTTMRADLSFGLAVRGAIAERRRFGLAAPRTAVAVAAARQGDDVDVTRSHRKSRVQTFE